MTTQVLSCIEEVAQTAGALAKALTIRCYAHSAVASSSGVVLPVDRELASEAMTLLMQIDRDLRSARADWNDDRFRRLMRLRSIAVRRLQRRWTKLQPQPRIPLGSLRRRYHANLAGYLRAEPK